MSNAEPWYDHVREARRGVETGYERGGRGPLPPSFARLRKSWEKRAGALVDTMLQRRDVAEQHLRHPDPMVRMVALRVVSYYWASKPGDDAARVCEELALHDPDSDTRGAALIALGECYWNTDDIRIGKLLAGIAHDEREVPFCRVAACQSLYSLRGLRMPLWRGVFASPPTMPRVPEDIDWAFVDSFLVGRRTPCPEPIGYEAIYAHLCEPDRTAVRLYDQGCDAYERGDYERSLELFTRSINTSPSLAGVRVVRGGAHVKLGNVDDAIADFTEAIKGGRQAVRAYRSRAVAYRLKGRNDLADADRRKADELESERRREQEGGAT